MENMDAESLSYLVRTLAILRENKPNDRSDRDRIYAIVITDMEKTIAYFKHMVMDNTD